MFTLADEVYGVDISRIKEVLEYTTLTKVPRTPEFMCGVINLRGSVVLLNSDKVFSSDELDQLQGAGQAGEKMETSEAVEMAEV